MTSRRLPKRLASFSARWNSSSEISMMSCGAARGMPERLRSEPADAFVLTST